MNRMPPIAAVAVGASSLIAGLPALAASASSTPAPTAPAAACTAVPEGATVVAAGPNGASIERAVGSEPLSLPVVSAKEKVVRGPDGTMWVQAFGERGVEIHRVAPDGTGTMLAIGPNLRLGAAGWLDGRSAATVIDPDFVRENEIETHGAIRLEFADGESRDIGPAGAPEFGVMSASIGGGRVALGAWSDQTEAFVFSGADGTELDDWADPTDHAPYAEPPLFQFPAGALSGGDGAAELLWVEGPDSSGASSEVSGGWSLVAATAADGVELMRVDLGDQPALLLDADWDGRFWTGTFAEPAGDAGETRPIPSRVLVVDTDAAAPAPIDAGCAAGVTASLDRLGTPAPTPAPVPPPTAGPSTAPSSTVPGRCADYVDADHAYPIQRCERGAAVRGVQLMLIRRGFGIEADGYFGPATDAAVRQFQAGAGVAVDGLVGPDTWGALYDPSYLPGADNDASGVVDPWELVLDPDPGAREGAGWIGRTFPYPVFDTGEGSHAGSADIDGVPVWAVWPVGDGPAGSYHGLLVFPGENTATLLLTVGQGAQPATLTVVDAIDPGRLAVLALECAIDGVADPSVAAMVTLDTSTSALVVSTDAAWRLSAGSEHIEPLDAGAVDCTGGNLVVD